MSTAPQPAAIEVSNLSHAFGDRWAVRHASFVVRAGSLHGFVGPNGAGKTTTLKAICTLLPPQAGQVRVFGLDVVKQAFDVRRQLGFMPDHFSMYRRMTVFEYIDFFAAAYGIPLARRDKAITDVLAITEMQARRDDLVSALSRGMQQRVALSRVLVSDPDLLLLDEPASGLDPRARIELMEILRALQGMGKTIFISSHILAELAELCDSVTIIDAGQVKYSGPIEQLLVRKGDQLNFRLKLEPATTDYRNILAGLSGVVTVDRVEPGDYRLSMQPRPDAAAVVLRAMLDAGAQVQSFGEDRRHLNEAFMDLTRGGVN